MILLLQKRQLQAERRYKEAVRLYNRGKLNLQQLDEYRNDYNNVMQIVEVYQEMRA